MTYTYLGDGTKVAAVVNLSAPASTPTDNAILEQNISGMDLGLLDFGARYYDPYVARWTSVDPMASINFSNSSFSYCSDNPINKIDSNGNWDIYVHASSDRDRLPYASLHVVDNNGKVVYRTVVKTKGTGGRDRSVENADTPFGTYTILEWRKTGTPRYNKSSYGPDYLLALDYKGEEDGPSFSRQGIHLHGGGKQEGGLSDTWGCIRINNEDIKEIRTITDSLEENNPNEKKGTLFVERKEANASYEDRRTYKLLNQELPRVTPPSWPQIL